MSGFENFTDVSNPSQYFDVVNSSSDGLFSLLVLFLVFFFTFIYTSSYNVIDRFLISSTVINMISPLMFFAGWISFEIVSIALSLLVLTLLAKFFIR